ncbi:hypothetical protein [Streptomyces sp. VB1]|uniref:hypothetical protein n=1 Tax=Streptomyces sp. VB1 TaxID=2986803 RepID=UPI002241ED16|nr:hypothetical protein [Streptomyces sp. VB1]UZI33959.1 hypothetical protein OH133_38805 [Streptomyces sp. VB1]
MTISTPRLDSLAAGGTNHVFVRVRLADDLTLALKAAPGADMADEVGLLPGLFPPATEAWANEDRQEDWLTGGALGQGGGLYLNVPMQAVRDLVEQHGGEHANQDLSRPVEFRDGVNAAQLAIEALAARGISADIDEDAGNSWLVVGEDADTGSHAVLCLFRGDDDETVVLRVPDLDRDDWHAATVIDGAELLPVIWPAARLGECVEAIAAWIAEGRPARSLTGDTEGPIAPDYAVGDRVWLKNNNGVPIVTMNNTHTLHETVIFTIQAVNNGRYELDTDNKFARRRHCGGSGVPADRLMRPQAAPEDGSARR